MQSNRHAGHLDPSFLRHPRHQISYRYVNRFHQHLRTYSSTPPLVGAAVKLHREQFWESISKYLISERIIWKMAYGIRYRLASIFPPAR